MLMNKLQVSKSTANLGNQKTEKFKLHFDSKETLHSSFFDEILERAISCRKT